MAKNQTIQHKRSTVAGNKPTTAQVAVGELAINFADKSIYTQTPGGLIIELARDAGGITKAAIAPTVPAPVAGDLYYNTTTDVLNVYNGTEWVNAAFTGKPILPANTTAPLKSSGSGALATPFLYTATSPVGSSVLIDTITITGLAPGQFVQIADLNSVTNGGRFTATNNFANAAGVLTFGLLFNDLPTSTAGTVYNAAIKVGSGSVYINIAMTTVAVFAQDIDTPTTSNAVSTAWAEPPETITATGDLTISVNDVVYGVGPLAVATNDTVYTKWAGAPGSGTGIDSANGTVITGEIVDSAGAKVTKTITVDKVVSAITFTPKTGMGLSTLVESDPVTISGINSYVYLTSADTVSASINGGSWTAVPASGTTLSVSAGDTLALRQTSSASASTTTTVAIDISGVSASFAVTTGLGSVNTPSFTSPLNNSSGISSSLTFITSAYAVVGAVGAHASTDWEIYSDSTLTTLVASSIADTVNKTSWAPSGLSNSTQYWARVRYRSADGTPVVSAWSTTRTWTIGQPLGMAWTLRAGLVDINDIVWNGSTYVAVGVNAKVYTSVDGITWTNRTQLTTLWGATNRDAHTIAWNGNKFVVAGQNGKIATSPDGITWTNQTSLVASWGTNTILDILWNGSQWLAIGTNGYRATSPDGITWTNRGTGGADLNAAVWDGAQYVVVGNSGRIMTTPDGITWTTRTAGLTGTSWGTSSVTAIAWDGGKYVIGGTNGTTNIAVSTDAIIWVPQNWLFLTNWPGIANVTNMLWTGEQFIVIGNNSAVATSTDGIFWTYQSVPAILDPSRDLNSIAWNGSQYVVAGQVAFTSP